MGERDTNEALGLRPVLKRSISRYAVYVLFASSVFGASSDIGSLDPGGDSMDWHMPVIPRRNPMKAALWLSAVASLFVSALMADHILTRPGEIAFKVHQLDLGSSESAAFADVNGDGKMDIVSGESWYEAPHWTKHHFREIPFINNYIDDLSTVPLDVDGDGKIDFVTVGWFSKKLAWWHNPGSSGTWKEHVVTEGFPIEFAELVDLNNDGKAEEVLPEFGDKAAPLAWFERDGHGGLQKHVASSRSYGHGIGAGDVNKDGRNDILTPSGWLEAPQDFKAGDWKLHPEWNLGDVGFMYVYDVNEDGKPDVITSMAHNYGIFWLENKGNGTWEKHMIDESWSQSHAVTITDLRGGHNLGLLTGKRFMAHNGRDPGESEPLGVYWYERLFDPDSKRVEWAKHVIEYGGRIGGGLQIPVVDLDGDGDLDFAVAGKSGLFLFENQTR